MDVLDHPLGRKGRPPSLLAVALFLVLGGWACASSQTASPPAATDPLGLARAAAAAQAEGRFDDAAALYRRFLEALPHSMSVRVAAAGALARAGRSVEALAELETAVALGLRFDTADGAWDGLRSDPRFVDLVSRMEAHTAPRVRSTVAFRLAEDLIPENIAHDPTSGAFFVGSMYHAKILRIGPDGTVTDFVPPRHGGLLAVLGMKVDPRRRELWAAAGNFGDRPPMAVPDPATAGRGALFRFDVDSGRPLGVFWGPGGSPEEPLQFNDLVLDPRGDVYATAGERGIWRLRHGAAEVEPFASRPGAFFNGITMSEDGATILAASHLEGVVRIEVASGAQSVVSVPPGTTLAGIDGLYLHAGSLVGIQNGTDPIRVVRAWLDPAMTRVVRFAVLEQEHPESDIPLTGTIVGDDLYYVARSQLRAFDGDRIWPPERLEPSVILRLPLGDGDEVAPAQ